MKEAESLSINMLLASVQRAYRALVPIAEDLGLRWKEPDNYHDWDAAAAGIFEGFVIEAIRSSKEWGVTFPLLNIDRAVADYTPFQLHRSGGVWATPSARRPRHIHRCVRYLSGCRTWIRSEGEGCTEFALRRLPVFCRSPFEFRHDDSKNAHVVSKTAPRAMPEGLVDS